MTIQLSAPQPDLFPVATPPVDDLPFPVSYEPIPVRRSTFLAGLAESVHSWFRLTPSFGPDLVRTILETMEVPNGAHIHDPFSGAGTTAIEATLLGHRASTIEVNPLLYFVGKTSLDWNISATEARRILSDIRSEFDRCHDIGLTEIESLGVRIPPIHNIHRWWREDVLRDMLVLKAAIRKVSAGKYLAFFELVLAAVLVPDLSNVTLGKLQLHFIDRSHHTIETIPTFQRHADKMIADLVILNDNYPRTDPIIRHADSTLATSFDGLGTIDAVVTSPPYPNRYSYVWNTRPHLYMLDMITVASEASAIDRRTIGGTWGTATSELAKGVFEPLNETVLYALDGVHQRIGETDQLMANYIVHYFNRMAQHLIAIQPSLSATAKLAYVVGNSRVKGQYVATDVILGRMIEGLIPNAQVDLLHRFRRRNSGVNLYETTVFASRKLS